MAVPLSPLLCGVPQVAVCPGSVPPRGRVPSSSRGRMGSSVGRTPVQSSQQPRRAQRCQRGPPIPPALSPWCPHCPLGHAGAGGERCWEDAGGTRGWDGRSIAVCHLQPHQGDLSRDGGRRRGHRHLPAQVPIPRGVGRKQRSLERFTVYKKFIQLVSDFSSTEWVLNSYRLLRVQLQPI